MATELPAEEAQARLPELLDRVEAGEEIVLTRFGVPSVTLRRAGERGSRTGALGGAAWLAPVAAADAGDAASTFDVGTDYSAGDVGLSG